MNLQRSRGRFRVWIMRGLSLVAARPAHTGAVAEAIAQH
jgi:hypothetical protein